MRIVSAAASLFFLILILLSITSQGIRLQKEFMDVSHKKIQVETERDQIGGGVESCKGTAQLCSGRSSTELMNNKMEVLKELSNSKIPPKNSKLINKEHSAATMKYPEPMDLAGMDYSPAKRKPPIHN